MDPARAEYVSDLAHTLAETGPAAGAIILLIIALPLIYSQRASLPKPVFVSCWVFAFIATIILVGTTTYLFIKKTTYYLYSWQLENIPSSVIVNDNNGKVFVSRWIPLGKVDYNYNIEYKPESKSRTMDFFLSFGHGNGVQFSLPMDDKYFDAKIHRYVALYNGNSASPSFSVRDNIDGKYKSVLPAQSAGTEDAPLANTHTTLLDRLIQLVSVANAAEKNSLSLDEIKKLLDSPDLSINVDGYRALSASFADYKSWILDQVRTAGSPYKAGALYALAGQIPAVSGLSSLTGPEGDLSLLEPVLEALSSPSPEVRHQANRIVRKSQSQEASNQVIAFFDTLDKRLSEGASSDSTAWLAFSAMDFYYNRAVSFWLAAKDGNLGYCSKAPELFKKAFSYRPAAQPDAQIYFGKVLFGKAKFSDETLTEKGFATDCPKDPNPKQEYKAFIDYVAGLDQYYYPYPDQLDIANAALKTS